MIDASRSTAAPLVDAFPAGHPALETVGYVRARSPRALRAWSRADISWGLARLTVDALMLASAAFAAAFGATAAGLAPTPNAWAAGFAGFALAILYARGAYGPDGRRGFRDEIVTAATAAGVAALGILALRLFFEPRPELVVDTGRLAAYGAAYVVAGRAVLAWSGAEVRFRRSTSTPTLILGAGVAGRVAAERLADHPTIGLRPVGFLDDGAPEEAGEFPILGRTDDLERVAYANGIRHVVVTASTAPFNELLAVVERCERIGLRVSFLAGSSGG